MSTKSTPKKKAVKKPSIADDLLALKESFRLQSDFLIGWQKRLEDRLTAIESKLPAPPTEPREEGLEEGHYTDASENLADELTAMGWKWSDDDRYKHRHIGKTRLDESHPAMLNFSHDSLRKIAPDEFLSRARITAKKLGLKPEEWVPCEGDLVVPIAAAANGENRFTGRVLPIQHYDGEGNYFRYRVRPEDDLNSNTWFSLEDLRPATDAEVAIYNKEKQAKQAEADKLANLKWGMHVKYQDQDALYIGSRRGCHTVMVDGYFTPHQTFDLSDITLIEP